jgi:predicted RNase H-like nuclease (RuvC/YqgF family)
MEQETQSTEIEEVKEEGKSSEELEQERWTKLLATMTELSEANKALREKVESLEAHHSMLTESLEHLKNQTPPRPTDTSPMEPLTKDVETEPKKMEEPIEEVAEIAPPIVVTESKSDQASAKEKRDYRRKGLLFRKRS